MSTKKKINNSTNHEIEDKYSYISINNIYFKYLVIAILSVIPLLLLYLFLKFKWLSTLTGTLVFEISTITLLIIYISSNEYFKKTIKVVYKTGKISIPESFGIFSYIILIAAYLPKQIQGTATKIDLMLLYLLAIYIVVIVYTIAFMFPFTPITNHKLRNIIASSKFEGIIRRYNLFKIKIISVINLYIPKLIFRIYKSRFLSFIKSCINRLSTKNKQRTKVKQKYKQFNTHISKIGNFYESLSKSLDKHQLDYISSIIFNDKALSTFIDYHDNGLESKTDGKLIVKNLRKLKSRNLNAFNKIELKVKEQSKSKFDFEGYITLFFTFCGLLTSLIIHNIFGLRTIIKDIKLSKNNSSEIMCFGVSILIILIIVLSIIYFINHYSQRHFSKELFLLFKEANGKA